MLDVDEVIARKQRLLIYVAIEQRKKAKRAKRDFIARLKQHDYTDCIRHTEEQIRVLQTRLEQEKTRQASLPATFTKAEKQIERWSEEQIRLQKLVPKNLAGKIAARLHDLGLSLNEALALIEGQHDKK